LTTGGTRVPTTETGSVALTAGQGRADRGGLLPRPAGGDSVSLGWRVPARSLLIRPSRWPGLRTSRWCSPAASRPRAPTWTSIDLPGEQNQLIRRGGSGQPNTIVVLHTGSRVTMPWLVSVKAVVEAWYPGQEDGHAVARCCSADINPSGKLPGDVVPQSLADVPAASAAQWPGVGGSGAVLRRVGRRLTAGTTPRASPASFRSVSGLSGIHVPVREPPDLEGRGAVGTGQRRHNEHRPAFGRRRGAALCRRSRLDG